MAEAQVRDSEGREPAGTDATRRQRLKEVLDPKGEARTPAEIVAELDIEDRIDAAELALEHEKNSLELAKSKQEILEKYTRDKMTRELEAEVAKAHADELARKATWQLERSKEDKLRSAD